MTAPRPAALPVRESRSAGRRNFGLDLIRATAICLVLVDHYATIAPVCGVLGVELFFVLSGFLIGGILYKSVQDQTAFTWRDLGRFWVRRWLRTLPNYYLFLGVFTVLAVFRTGIDWPIFWPHLLFLQNLTHPPAAFFGVSWSLAVEEWFYLLFPLGFFLIYQLTGKPHGAKRAIFLCCAFCLAAIAITLRFQADAADWSARMRLTVVYRFDAIMYGVGLAVLRTEYASVWNSLRRNAYLGGMLVLLGTVAVHRSLLGCDLVLPAAWLLAIVPVSFALVLPWATHLDVPTPWVESAVVYVSRCSYSIYLCHLPVLFLAMQAGHDGQRGTAGKLLIRTSALALTLVVSGLLYRFVEKPILNLAPKDRRPPSYPLSPGRSCDA